MKNNKKQIEYLEDLLTQVKREKSECEDASRLDDLWGTAGRRYLELKDRIYDIELEIAKLQQ